MRYCLIILALVWGQAGAGEWFRTIEIKAGIGTEYFECHTADGCSGYDIGNGPIGKFSIAQSIYSDDNFRVEIEWDHMSDLTTSTRETPIDYFGVNLQSEFDWY